jgi:hypothetical protein
MVGVLGDTIIGVIGYYLPVVSSSAHGSEGTLILCHNVRLCRWVSRQTSYDAGYTAVLLVTQF